MIELINAVHHVTPVNSNYIFDDKSANSLWPQEGAIHTVKLRNLYTAPAASCQTHSGYASLWLKGVNSLTQKGACLPGYTRIGHKRCKIARISLEGRVNWLV